MKLFKIILILILLFGISVIVWGNNGETSPNYEVIIRYDGLEINDWDTWHSWDGEQWIPIKGVPYKESGNYIEELEEEIERLNNKIKDLSDGEIGKTRSDIRLIEEAEWQPKTLESWFEHLTLGEKAEIYKWWKYESVNLVLDVSKYGDITIRVNKNEERRKEGE